VSRLGYDLHGPADAPVVVLGSSLGTDRRMWAPQLPALAARYRLLRYDHRGHGTSVGPDGPYRLLDLAADVLELLDELGIRRFSIGGVSLGGMVAMQVAAVAEDRVASLALFCTAAVLPPAAGWRERAATVRAGGTAAIADQVLERWFTPGFAAAEPAVVTAHRRQLLAVSSAGYAGCCEAIAAMDLRPLLSSITAPTLIVAGAEDRATPPAYAHDIADGIRAGSGPGPVRVDVVPGAHLATVESAAHCTDLLLAHLAGRNLEDHRGTDRQGTGRRASAGAEDQARGAG
jgi:3-oxoadipate enol-lactonase